MGLGPGGTAGGPYGRIVQGASREPPLEQQFKKQPGTAVPCSVCGKIIKAEKAIIRENKVYCDECFKTNVEKHTRKTNANSRQMVR